MSKSIYFKDGSRVVLTENQVDILIGAAGLRYAKTPYRNRFHSPPDAYHRADCALLVDANLMVGPFGEAWFALTDRGTEARALRWLGRGGSMSNSNADGMAWSAMGGMHGGWTRWAAAFGPWQFSIDHCTCPGCDGGFAVWLDTWFVGKGETFEAAKALVEKHVSDLRTAIEAMEGKA